MPGRPVAKHAFPKFRARVEEAVGPLEDGRELRRLLAVYDQHIPQPPLLRRIYEGTELTTDPTVRRVFNSVNGLRAANDLGAIPVAELCAFDHWLDFGGGRAVIEAAIGGRAIVEELANDLAAKLGGVDGAYHVVNAVLMKGRLAPRCVCDLVGAGASTRYKHPARTQHCSTSRERRPPSHEDGRSTIILYLREL